MKNKTLLSLAAILLLAPAAFAQTETPVQYQHEKYSLENGVGFNKYLVSTKPNANSEYTLRLETFVTGSVKASALPTDFVLVIDNSGSMYYDYLPYGTTERPKYIAFDAASDTNGGKLLPYLVEGYGASDVSINFASYNALTYDYAYSVADPAYSNRVSTSNDPRYFYQLFYGENDTYASSQNRSTRYYKYDNPEDSANRGYYRIFKRKEGNYYNLCIRVGTSYKYLYGDSVHDTPNSTITRSDQIIYNGANIYHVKSRQEALLEGAKAFIGAIAKENGKDQWRPGVTKHQVSLVSFSVGYADGTASINEYPTALPSNDTKVIKSFDEVGDSTTWYGYIQNRMTFRGGQTCIDYGVNLAKMLLQDLETKDGGKYAALNTSGGVLRKKVVVVFTDGEPYDQRTGQVRNFFQITNPCIQYGKTIKEVGVGKLNGKIYTIDLCMSSSTEDFLGHLSSNYPKAGCSATSGNYSAGKFTGKKIPLSEGDVTEEEWEYLQFETTPYYYKNTKDGDLSSVFASIADGNTGQQAGEKLVVMDVMSDSFELPANLSGRVKFYTAQCIGEKEIDGEMYLAFAREVPVDEREPLAHLWVGHTEGEGAAAQTVWNDLGAETSGGLDIDQEVRAKKSSDGKSITVSGFEFVDLWCGKDELIQHNNNTRQMEANDPNAAYAADGYRGFKLIIEFPIVVSPGAVGGTGVPTNNEIQSGFYHGKDDGTAEGEPIINYQKPVLTIPVQLAVQKTGLGPNESASFTIQRRTMEEGSEWEDYLSFVLTSTSSDNAPIQRILNLNPDYYYRVKEDGWSWAYSNRAQVEATFPSTEDPNLTNPIVIQNDPIPNPPKHAEAVVRNQLKNY